MNQVTLTPLILALSLCALPSEATVMIELSFEQLVAESELIFRGHVIDSVEAQEGELIYTTVTFAIDEIVKGRHSTTTLQLRFLGGETHDFGVDVQGQFIPRVHDHGVYFVGDTEDAMVNPLAGWKQGYFPLLQNAQGQMFLDMRQRRDLEVPGFEENPRVRKMQALGFTPEQIEAKVPQALRYSWNDFRSAIRAVSGMKATP